MISVAIVISYDNDQRLGSYFKDCADYAVNNILKTVPLINDLEIIEINNVNTPANKWNTAYFDIKVLPVVSEKDSIIIIYSHGTSDAFLFQQQAFIRYNIDTDNISNTIIYTNSCSTGKTFGKTISEQGGVFIGYETDIEVPQDEDCIQLFIQCDNCGLVYLFHEKIELRNLRYEMRKKFTKCIDVLKKNGTKGFLYASYFRDARDSLVVLGQDLNRTVI
jgi:hypothetical protein